MRADYKDKLLKATESFSRAGAYDHIAKRMGYTLSEMAGMFAAVEGHGRLFVVSQSVSAPLAGAADGAGGEPVRVDDPFCRCGILDLRRSPAWGDFAGIVWLSVWPGEDPDPCLIVMGFDVSHRMFSFGNFEFDEESIHGADEHYGEAARLRGYLLSLFRFMKQRIIVERTVSVPKIVRRRGEPSTATTIVLRRPESRSGTNTDTDIEWSHRWLVRGHWRNQWIRKKKRHELRWIAPFIKGPEDKPLVLKDVRYEVKR